MKKQTVIQPPAIAKATVSQVGGTNGDITRAAVDFEVTNVVSGQVFSFGPVHADPSGLVTLVLGPGQVPLGAYTLRARLDPSTGVFRMTNKAPTAVVVNSDAISATVYTLSDLLNLITP